MDVDQVTKWMDALYDDGDQFELVAVKDSNARRKTFTYSLTTLPDVLGAVDAFEAAGFNVYASAMPTNVQAQGVFDRVWVDQDDLHGAWPFGVDKDVQWPKPTTMVKTSEEGGSYRWQAIWKLTDTLDLTAGSNMMKRMAKQIGADGSVHDARRILRVPGVVNAKRGMPARYMGGGADVVTSLDAFNLPEETAVQKLMEAQVRSPQGILGEWLAGFTEGERNQKAYVCARFLRSCDVEFDDALSIVALGASRCKPVLDEQEVWNAVRSAYHAG